MGHLKQVLFLLYLFLAFYFLFCISAAHLLIMKINLKKNLTVLAVAVGRLKYLRKSLNT